MPAAIAAARTRYPLAGDQVVAPGRHRGETVPPVWRDGPVCNRDFHGRRDERAHHIYGAESKRPIHSRFRAA
jgi:hypothetical protein